MARTHSREFKLLVCQRIEKGETSISQVCREHNLSMGMVDRWLQQFRIKREESFDGTPWRSENHVDDFKVIELENLLQQLLKERNSLKRKLEKENRALQRQVEKLTDKVAAFEEKYGKANRKRQNSTEDKT
ncbi:MAG: transposase [Fimbriimonadaceae bacterium]|jgi:transposase-like protein|nr:transposase [Fimbriimonadaceae bacterium]